MRRPVELRYPAPNNVSSLGILQLFRRKESTTGPGHPPMLFGSKFIVRESPDIVLDSQCVTDEKKHGFLAKREKFGTGNIFERVMHGVVATDYRSQIFPLMHILGFKQCCFHAA